MKRGLIISILCLAAAVAVSRGWAETRGEATKQVGSGSPTVASDAINALGLDLLRRGTQAERNALLSPYSVQVASAMVYAGALGKTREEMAAALHYPMDGSDIHGSLAALTRPIGELSRGNRQKIGLVLALFHGPELLILDEPTSGLDPLMQAEFLTVIGEQQARGTTVFLSSHELDEVQRVCDRVAIIRQGRLIATEHVQEMRGRGYRNVRVQFDGPARAEEFAGLAGVDGVSTDADTIQFRVHGARDPVIQALAGHEVVDLDVTRPSLDELFLNYYREPDGPRTAAEPQQAPA